MMVIDGDGHYVEPPDLWHEYVPRRMQDRVYVERDDAGLAVRLVAGNTEVPFVYPDNPFGWGDSTSPGGLRAQNRRMRRIEEGEPGGRLGDARLAFHDVEGIDAAVLFPSVAPLMCHRITDPEVALAVAEAINRWAADFCSVAPHELYSVAVLPALHPELAARELRRCVTEHGFVAACLRPMALPDGRTLDDPSFEPFWDALEDLDVPVAVHNVSSREPIPQAGMDRAPSFLFGHAVAHPFEAMLAYVALLQGRVLERHPRLRIGFMESSCGWAPFWLDRLHEHVEHLGWMFDPPLTIDPVDLFVERCVIGCEGDEKMAPYVQARLGDDRVVWSSDFPHFDVEAPFVAPVLQRDDMTTDQKEGLMWRAAAAFYRLDLDAITRSNRARRERSVAASAR